MGILDALFGARTQKSQPRAASQELGGGAVINIRNSHDLDRYLRGELGGAGAMPDVAMTVAAVYACVRLISGAVANMPLQIKRRVDGRSIEDADDHSVWNVLTRKPNRWMTPNALKRMQTAHILLRGNAYAYKVRNSIGEVIELLPMWPDRVKVDQIEGQELVYTYTKRNGGTAIYPQRDVFHLCGMTFDGVKGVSVLAYARNAVELSLNTEKHGNETFENGTHIGSVFMHPNHLSDEAIQHIKASLEEYRGSENAGKTLILEEGMDFKPLGMTAEDAQYIETRKFTRSEIAMFFGVPPHMIGDTEKATSWGTGIEQQSIGFRTYTLQDYLTTWEETVNRDLLDRDMDLFARFDTRSMVRADIKTRYEAHAIARQWGWESANDVREGEGLNPIEGGDVYLEPLNMVPMGSERNNEQDPTSEG